jgi:hypothetical protein
LKLITKTQDFSSFTLCITMKVDVANIEAMNWPLFHGDFDSELQEL